MWNMTTNETEYLEGRTGLYRSGDQIVSVMMLEGQRVVGVGDTIHAALLEGFKARYPEIEKLDIKLPAALVLPAVEDLPELPEGYLT